MMLRLQRRGFDLGEFSTPETKSDPLSNWSAGKPTLLKGFCHSLLTGHQQHIAQSKLLYLSILDNQECEKLLDQTPYLQRLLGGFECLGSSINEGDEQEIETIFFDAIENERTLAEDLWIKVSWLSFHQEDASIRFRFSFGVDLQEDVAADSVRQHHAAALTDAVFPESKLITDNDDLAIALTKTLKSNEIKFVERIIYFNSPQGGAYLHHDRERGHAGVVYAQLSGRTFWLALSKQVLMKEINIFVTHCVSQAWPDSINQESQDHLAALAHSTEKLASELETFANTTLISLINETPEFVAQLSEHGHSRVLYPGDLLLLPQEGEMTCCWHSVFCVGDEPGQALSFAIRAN